MQKPQGGANFWCKSPGVRRGMVMDEIDTCIRRTAHRKDFGTKLNLTNYNGAPVVDILKDALVHAPIKLEIPIHRPFWIYYWSI